MNLGAILTAMVTPFAADGRIDEEAAVRLMNHLVEHGSDGLVICGTTGEVSTLSDSEQLGLIDEKRFEFCWIVDFPMYEYDEEAKKVDFSHNPFSMPQG